jgi:CubicO group peptidase (beta-lactamase class C family)
VPEIPNEHMQAPPPSADPAALGLDPEKLEGLLARARRGLQESGLPSLQLAVARKGQLGLFATLGGAGGAQRYNTFSCTKAVVASAIWKLMSEGKLDVTRAVCDYFPEFAGEGKEAIRVEQLLYHTAGIPRAPMGPAQWFERDRRIEKMRSWRLNWEPGSRMEYHPDSAHWVLAELIERAGGIDYRKYLAQAVLLPLGLSRLQLGVPLDQQSDIAELIPVGEPPDREEVAELLGVAIDWPEVDHSSLLRFNEPRTRALGIPGGGAVSDAASLALFYQHLLHNTADTWDPDVLQKATGHVPHDFIDAGTGVAANRGLGVVIAGDDGMASRRGMGRNVSPRCFGQQGVGGQIAWGDPESGLSFCALTNGLDANPIRSTRLGAALSARAANSLL